MREMEMPASGQPQVLVSPQIPAQQPQPLVQPQPSAQSQSPVWPQMPGQVPFPNQIAGAAGTQYFPSLCFPHPKPRKP